MAVCRSVKRRQVCAMLQRQQAAAVIDAKKAIVEGAVGMVEMALNRLKTNNIVELDELEKEKVRLESLIMRVNEYIENIN